MKEVITTLGETETFEVVHRGLDVIIFEGGWWMKRRDHDNLWEDEETRSIRLTPNPMYGIDRNEKTKQLTLFVIPY